MNSKLLIHIIKEIETTENTIVLEEYITDLFVYTKQKNNNTLYRKDDNKLYSVDDSSKNIVPISLDHRQKQIGQIKDLFSNFDVQHKPQKNSRKVVISGSGAMVTISGEVRISTYPNIEDTTNLDAYKLLNKSSLIEIDMKNNEITDYACIDVNIQGKKTKNKTTIKSIETLTRDINRYDYLLNYSTNQL